MRDKDRQSNMKISLPLINSNGRIGWVLYVKLLIESV